MDFKITNYLPRFKEELPPINRPPRSSSSKTIKYERDINRIKMNHNQMLEELHKELEILRSKNRDLLDELIIMNGGNYCCKHLESLRFEILKSNASDNQKQLSDILNNAKIHQKSTEDIKNDKNYNYKKELPELIAVGNKFISKDIENKSNLLLQEQLYKSNKLIDILRQENIQQKAELTSLNSLLNKRLTISGVGLNNSLVSTNSNSHRRFLSSLSHPTISYMDIISSEENARPISRNE
ncbi:PREDICTED: uncharacterized protein LOC107168494 isoform X2 [Diuraphis noxia]|uniref:uncharacterized protein LOC107168494 isoform X2 n=1 Tax=Diuraphis noxia TaxID=143948 RepID=UPI000763A665|nr:PREDICTED: uncharacterized protein LOC107168494 isoform X2 [Diuraphis noxia]